MGSCGSKGSTTVEEEESNTVPSSEPTRRGGRQRQRNVPSGDVDHYGSAVGDPEATLHPLALLDVASTDSDDPQDMLDDGENRRTSRARPAPARRHSELVSFNEENLNETSGPVNAGAPPPSSILQKKTSLCSSNVEKGGSGGPDPDQWRVRRQARAARDGSQNSLRSGSRSSGSSLTLTPRFLDVDDAKGGGAEDEEGEFRRIHNIVKRMHAPKGDGKGKNNSSAQ